MLDGTNCLSFGLGKLCALLITKFIGLPGVSPLPVSSAMTRIVIDSGFQTQSLRFINNSYSACLRLAFPSLTFAEYI